MESSTKDTQPACQLGFKEQLTDRGYRDRVGGNPDGYNGDQSIAGSRCKRHEADSADNEDANRHECSSTEQKRSTTDLVNKIERHEYAGQKDAVDDQIRGEGVSQTDKGEKVDGVEHERNSDEILPSAAAKHTTHLDGDRHSRDESSSQIRTLETRKHAVFTGLCCRRLRRLNTLGENGILMVPVVSGDIANEPSSGTLSFGVVAPLVEPNRGFGETYKDRQPEAEKDELGVEHIAECEGCSLLSDKPTVPPTLLMISSAIAQASWPSEKKNA